MLEWRPAKHDASLAKEFLLDAQFEKSEVIARWPRLLEDEARRITKQPEQEPRLGFNKTPSPWAAHRAVIPLQEVLEFLAFGSLTQEGAQPNAARGGAVDPLQEMVDVFRASDAIFTAARDREIELLGEAAQTGGSARALLEPIAAVSFVRPMRSSS